MTNNSIVQQLHEIVEPFAASLSLDLWGIDVAFGGRSVICIYVEGPDGVTIEQCAELSRLVGLTLEVEDTIPDAYVLEVSSPGLERKYFTHKQLAGAIGNTIEVSLFAPKPSFPGRRKFKGTLADRKGETFFMLVEDCAKPGEETPVLEFTFSEAKKVRQIHFTPEKALPGKATKKKGKDTKKQEEAEEAENALLLTEQLRPLTPEEQELLTITGGCEAL